MNQKTLLGQRRKPERRGMMVALVGFMLIVLMGTISFVGDIGNVIVVRTTLGAAADAAALAGAGAMAQSYLLNDVTPVAVAYGQANVPASYGTVLDASNISYGVWNPDTRTFTPTNVAPNAVRVVVERAHGRGNEVPYFFGRVLGFDSTEVRAEAIAVGANSTTTPINYTRSVYVTSTRDLSNVVLYLKDPNDPSNTAHQKFENLSGYTANFKGTGLYNGWEVIGVWIKSGCNSSTDGPGYGEYVSNPGDGYTVHGSNQHKGCTPHVTATFEAAEGVEFANSGASSPVRLVK